MNTLAIHLDNFLKLRRQLGFKLRVPGILLRSFVRFAERQRASIITTKLALQWATRPRHIQQVQKARRLGVVRRFAIYLSAIEPRTEVPAKRLLPWRYRRRAPYLYSAEDVQRLIEATNQIGVKNPVKGVKGASHATLIGLMAVTGMRVGEVIALDRDGVDLSRGVITVRHTKGDRSRVLPIHSSTKKALQRYAILRDEAFPQPFCSSFFVSARGTQLVHCTVHRCFVSVASQIGLQKSGDRRGPRLHDLRHFFSIQTMLRWYRSDMDVEAHLPELSTYLGHAHVQGTYWYLSAVPELLQLATKRCQKKEATR
jgi:integrase